MNENFKKIVLTVIALCMIESFAFAGDTTRLIYATANPEGSAHAAHIIKFKQLIETYSNGKMTVEVFLNGIKGSEHDNVMDVSAGKLHMSTLAVNNITPFAPIVGFMTLPYMFPETQQARKLLLTKNPILDNVTEKMVETGNIRPLAWINLGYRVLTNSKRVVRSPSDLKGLNIRVPENPIMVATYRAWGVEPIPLAWTKTYDALEKGIIDGHDNAFMGHVNIPKSKKPFYEIQKYIVNIHYTLLIICHIINEDFFQSLSSGQQLIIQNAAKEATELEWDSNAHENDEILKYFLNHGMMLTEPAGNEEEWIEKGKSVWPQFYNRIGGKDFVDKAVRFLNSK